MSTIRERFSDLGFCIDSYIKIPNHDAFIADIDINSNKYGFLVVDSQLVGEKFLDESIILKHLEREIRYLLLLDLTLGIGVFVKRTLSSVGTNKFQKHKINLRSNNAKITFNSLRPNDYITFENLFNTEKVVSRFYTKYVEHLKNLIKNIDGIATKPEKQRYAGVLMSRLMFMQFLQTRNFFSDPNFLDNHLKIIHSKKQLYYEFLCTIFFDVLNTPKSDRSKSVSHYSNIGFLNGGLFRRHTLEKKYKNISIDNRTLSSIIDFFRSWTWFIDETNVSNDGINPVILGHIFEQTIDNQKEKGAFYTPVDVTRYICEKTILSYVIERINTKFRTKYDLNANSSFDQIFKNKAQTIYMYFEVIKPLTILDNACGSGEFLLRSFGILLDLYVRTWDALSHFFDPKIDLEKSIISKSSPSSRYYFRRRIVTQNLFGVDMDNGAIEVCQLRLWLGLVSDMDLATPEALPNIDYNILHGNTLLGFITPDSLQSNFSTDIPTQHDYTQIATVKNQYKESTNPSQAATLKIKLDHLISKCDSQLSAALYKNRKKYGVFNPEHLPFHWLLNFPTIICNNGGFDIIVGNPPYVQSQKINFPLQFKLLSCQNTYVYFIEKSLQLLKPGGKLGYIIPVSSVSTSKMVPMIEHLKSRCSKILVSHYDDRPGRLFVGLQHCRSSIFICTRSSESCHIYTTGYKRWYTNERNTLFDNVEYVNVTKFTSHPRLGKLIPKLANSTEISILEKLLSNTESVSKYITKASTKKTKLHPVYYHNAPQYWTRAHMHEIKSTRLKDGVQTHERSSHLKLISCNNSYSQIVTLALLNSSLFYWWFVKMSNGRDFGEYLIRLFPINIDDIINNKKLIQKLSKIVYSLLKDYDINAVSTINTRKDTSVLTFSEYFPSKSKVIIDKIDAVLGNHYNFTQKELNYIRMFDLKFRCASKN